MLRLGPSGREENERSGRGKSRTQCTKLIGQRADLEKPDPQATLTAIRLVSRASCRSHLRTVLRDGEWAVRFAEGLPLRPQP